MPSTEWDGEAPPQDQGGPLSELGISGLRRTGGYLDEEFLPQLRGRKSVQVFREMSENDPTVHALVFSFDRLLRQVEWRVEPGDSSDEQRVAAEFLESCMNDMSHTWDEFLSDALTCIVFGWSWHEIVYKRRIGPWEDDPKKRSKHTDGMVGWRKLPIRAQETLHHWQFDENSGVKGMWQMAPPDYKMRYLPIERSLLFRPITYKNSPEGRSLLRGAYRPWFFKKRHEEFEAVGVERDLVGMPVARLPVSYLTALPGTKEAKVVDATRKLIRGVRRDEHEGILWPTYYNRDTKMDEFGFDLLGGGGTRQFNTHQIIERYDTRILMSVLADFILVGHQGVGSYSMHTDKTGLFRASVNTISQAIADVMNQHAVPRLFKMNQIRLETLPKFVPNNVDPPDLTQLAGFVSALTSAGVQFFPDPELEKWVRSAAQMPELDEREMRAREQEARYSEVLRVAQARMSVVNLQAQAVQQATQMDAQSMMVQQQRQGMLPPGGQPPGAQPPQGPPGGPPGAPPPRPEVGAAPGGPPQLQKRLDDVHGRRWRRLKRTVKPHLDAAADVGEELPPQSTLGIASRAYRAKQKGDGRA